MGMGEPFDNYDNVVSAIDVMLDNFGFNLSARRVTVSTSGIVPRIQQYARECRSQLAVSLNSTTNEVRYELMPVNKRWPIEEIVRAVDESYGDDRRRVTFEYILMRDLNDSPDDARRLAKLLRGLPCKVNLIPYNENPWANYGRPTDETITQFQNLLLKQGYNATIRWSRGPDIRAACGQLKSREGEGRNGSENRDHWGQRALSASGA
jgi:23S rRNA (adenine2503-C2)-methyltransferase